MDIIFATKNRAKAAEVSAMLSGTGYRVISMDQAGIDIEVNEDGRTFEENAVKKASEVMGLCGKLVLADDSGLEIDALDGRPGVYSARFLGEGTPYVEKNAEILKMLKGVANRGARFRCVIAAAFPDGRILKSEGTLEGEIAHLAAGSGGFGYDPIFFVPGYGMTLAQMPAAQKNEISHRGQALRKMKEVLDSEHY